MSNERSERIEVLMADIQEIKRKFDHLKLKLGRLGADIKQAFDESLDLYIAGDTVASLTSRIAAIEEVIDGNETLQAERMEQ